VAEKYAKIIVDISHEKVDRPFTYRIPQYLKEQVEVGSQVRIPFGMGNKLMSGYVIELSDTSEYPPEKLKEISEIVTTAVQVESRQIKLAAWMKEHYGSTMIASLKTVLPVKQKVKQLESKTVSLSVDNEKALELLNQFKMKRQVAKARLLEELMVQEYLAYSVVTGKLGVSGQTIRGMQDKGIIRIEVAVNDRNPIKVRPERKMQPILNKEQAEIVSAFCHDFQNGIRKVYLLHGVTGSGKTEVYMGMIEKVLQEGKQVIVLIPEIALTYQTMRRFYERFGEQVSVVNSRLSAGEKYDQFMRAKKGEVKVMIGPRTALFTPFPNLGLIVIDEEHEGSYKSDLSPKFHARETAVYLAGESHASVILGSATPSMEAYYKAKNGEYTLFTLTQRAKEASLPTTQIVDMREELRCGNYSIFSDSLREKIADRLEKKQQIMLFLNRRGYAGFVSCRACGHVMKCTHCDVSLTDHRNGRLVCHYCGFERPGVSNCPECGSKYISGFKVGTEKIEEQLKTEFPNAKVLRMDADTTKKKDDFEKILQTFSNEEADILVGTQMIVKGHDFSKVTLVGILAADLSLSAGDYRASERTFQLLTQAAGRAGRGEFKGEVVIQTYQPEHYAIALSAKQDYTAFYEEEIAYRELMDYPPASHLLAVLVTGKDEEEVIRVAKAMADRSKVWGENHNMCVLGPAKAGVSKINDLHRQMIYMKHSDYAVLIQAKDRMELFLKINEKQIRQTNVYFDFDPQQGY